MNLGLGNLTELKAYLLAEDLRAETAWDPQIMAIGLGVAAAFERTCNRRFVRVVADQVEFAADRLHFVLPRFPIEDLTAIDFRETMGSSWTSILSALESWSSDSGLVIFGYEPGSHANRVRVTYTGGYWIDITEDASGAMPGTATLLPADLKLAWLQHCRATWAKYPKLGTPINTVSQPSALVTMNYAPDVLDVLRDYTRTQLT